MDRDDNEEKQPRERLTYEPPAVVSEEVFETLALSCGRASPLACFGQPPNS